MSLPSQGLAEPLTLSVYSFIVVRSLLVRAAALALLAGQAPPVAGWLLCDSRPQPAAEACDGVMGGRPSGPALAPGSADAMPPCALMGACAQPAPALAIVASLAAAPVAQAAAPHQALAVPSSFDRLPTSPPPQV